MSFYQLPFGHTEWHVDSRNPAAQRPVVPAELPLRRPRVTRRAK